jgi:hypothetical protein
MFKTANIFLLIGLLLCEFGCGGSQKGLAPVEGTVMLDGTPMPGVYVFFDQPDASKNRAFIGQTDEQGHFELREAGEKYAGTPPGPYRVTLSTAVAKPGSPDGAPLPPERVPPKYARGKLKLDVPESGKTDVRFDLKTRG